MQKKYDIKKKKKSATLEILTTILKTGKRYIQKEKNINEFTCMCL